YISTNSFASLKSSEILLRQPIGLGKSVTLN
ncbi:MAG: hypothetical protein ACI8RA_002781, partial [Chlamydiales bacterium]